jgi:hypothetical protein
MKLKIFPLVNRLTMEKGKIFKKLVEKFAFYGLRNLTR